MGGRLMRQVSLRHSAWTVWALSLAIALVGPIVRSGAVVSGQLAAPGEPNLVLGVVSLGMQVVIATLGALIVSR